MNQKQEKIKNDKSEEVCLISFERMKDNFNKTQKKENKIQKESIKGKMKKAVKN